MEDLKTLIEEKCKKCAFFNDLIKECEAYVEDALNCKEFRHRRKIKEVDRNFRIL